MAAVEYHSGSLALPLDDDDDNGVEISKHSVHIDDQGEVMSRLLSLESEDIPQEPAYEDDDAAYLEEYSAAAPSAVAYSLPDVSAEMAEAVEEQPRPTANRRASIEDEVGLEYLNAPDAPEDPGDPEPADGDEYGTGVLVEPAGSGMTITLTEPDQDQRTVSSSSLAPSMSTVASSAMGDPKHFNTPYDITPTGTVELETLHEAEETEWVQVRSADGVVYYHNTRTDETSWEPPASEPSPRSDSANRSEAHRGSLHELASRRGQDGGLGVIMATDGADPANPLGMTPNSTVHAPITRAALEQKDLLPSQRFSAAFPSQSGPAGWTPLSIGSVPLSAASSTDVEDNERPPARHSYANPLSSYPLASRNSTLSTEITERTERTERTDPYSSTDFEAPPNSGELAQAQQPQPSPVLHSVAEAPEHSVSTHSLDREDPPTARRFASHESEQDQPPPSNSNIPPLFNEADLAPRPDSLADLGPLSNRSGQFDQFGYPVPEMRDRNYSLLSSVSAMVANVQQRPLGTTAQIDEAEALLRSLAAEHRIIAPGLGGPPAIHRVPTLFDEMNDVDDEPARSSAALSAHGQEASEPSEPSEPPAAPLPPPSESSAGVSRSSTALSMHSERMSDAGTLVSASEAPSTVDVRVPANSVAGSVRAGSSRSLTGPAQSEASFVSMATRTTVASSATTDRRPSRTQPQGKSASTATLNSENLAALSKQGPASALELSAGPATHARPMPSAATLSSAGGALVLPSHIPEALTERSDGSSLPAGSLVVPPSLPAAARSGDLPGTRSPHRQRSLSGNMEYVEQTLQLEQQLKKAAEHAEHEASKVAAALAQESGQDHLAVPERPRASSRARKPESALSVDSFPASGDLELAGIRHDQIRQLLQPSAAPDYAVSGALSSRKMSTDTLETGPVSARSKSGELSARASARRDLPRSQSTSSMHKRRVSFADESAATRELFVQFQEIAARGQEQAAPASSAEYFASPRDPTQRDAPEPPSAEPSTVAESTPLLNAETGQPLKPSSEAERVRCCNGANACAIL